MLSYEQNSVYQQQFGGVLDIKVVNLYIHALDTANNFQVLPAVRPYQITPDMNSLEQLGASVVRAYGAYKANYTGTAASLSNGVIKLSDIATQLVDIPYSWSQERFGFICVLYVNNNSRESIEIISGYTNYNGISYNQTIDPSMLFFVNKITSINRNGMVSAVDVLENQHNPVIASNGYTLQPALPSNLVNEASNRLDTDINSYNSVRSISNELTPGNVVNNIPSKFLNVIINGTLAVKGTADNDPYGWSPNGSTMVDKIATYSGVLHNVSSSNDVRFNRFKPIDLLANSNHYMTPDEYGNKYMKFTLNDLSNITKQSIDAMNIILTTNQPVITMNHAEGSLAQTNIGAVKVQALFNVINTLALTNHLSKLKLIILYVPMEGRYVVNIDNCMSIINIEGLDWVNNYIMSSVAYFKAALEDYINSCLAADGLMLYADVDYNLMINTAITISVDNDQPTMYVIPTYVSSAMSPTYNTQQQFNNLVDSVSNVIDYFSTGLQ